MEYQENNLERIFSIKFSAGEPLIPSLESLIKEKNIGVGIIGFLAFFPVEF